MGAEICQRAAPQSGQISVTRECQILATVPSTICMNLTERHINNTLVTDKSELKKTLLNKKIKKLVSINLISCEEFGFSQNRG